MILAQASGTGGGVLGLGVTGFLVGGGDDGRGPEGFSTSLEGLIGGRLEGFLLVGAFCV